MISATSPKQNYFDLPRYVHISQELRESNLRIALREDTYHDEILPANSNKSLWIIRLKGSPLPYVEIGNQPDNMRMQNIEARFCRSYCAFNYIVIYG